MFTVIIPYKEGEPIRDPPEGDETLWIDSDLDIGEARIKGALEASNEWLIQVDADGHYPDDYIEKIRDAIASGEYPDGFWCIRRGGLKRTYMESGLVVHRELFLERVKDFVPNHRLDVGSLFNDLPINDEITYWHGLTKNEKSGVLLLLILLLL